MCLFCIWVDAPWCGHCLQLAPEYAKAAQELEEKGSEIKLGKVDAIEETKLKEEFDITGYPTMKFFRSGKPIEYTGGRQADEIIKWVEKRASPIAEIESVKEAEEFIKSQPVGVIGFFKDRESDEAKAFLNASDAAIDYEFGITSNDDVYAKYEAKCGSIILFKDFDDEKSIFEGELTEEAILKFVAIHSLPLVLEYNREAAKKVFGKDVENQFLMFVSYQEGNIDKYVQPVKDVAKQFVGKVLFISINVDEELNRPILNFFGIKENEIPTMRIFRMEDLTKFKPNNSDLSSENVKSFVQDFLDDKLKKHLLSADLPGKSLLCKT